MNCTALNFLFQWTCMCHVKECTNKYFIFLELKDTIDPSVYWLDFGLDDQIIRDFSVLHNVCIVCGTHNKPRTEDCCLTFYMQKSNYGCQPIYVQWSTARLAVLCRQLTGTILLPFHIFLNNFFPFFFSYSEYLNLSNPYRSRQRTEPFHGG